MEIGRELKALRKNLNLTQSEMAGAVLSTSYYSKIERGLNDIQLQDLVDILGQHRIRASKFIAKVENDAKNSDEIYNVELWRDEFKDAYYHQDVGKIIDLKNKFQRYMNHSPQAESLYFISIFAIALLQGKVDEIPNYIKNKVKNIVFSANDWDDYNLKVFSMTMMIYDHNDMDLLIDSILKKYRDVAHLSNHMQDLLSSITINYLANLCLQNRKEQAGKVYKFVDELPEIPRNFFAKTIVNYYRYYLEKDYEKADEIIKFLSENGMSHLVKNFIIPDK